MSQAAYSHEIQESMQRLRMRVRELVLQLDIPIEIALSDGTSVVHPMFSSLRTQFLLYIAGISTHRSAFDFFPFLIYREMRMPLFWYFRRRLDRGVSFFFFGLSGLSLCIVAASLIWQSDWFDGHFEMVARYSYFFFVATILTTFVHMLVPMRLKKLPAVVDKLVSELEQEIRVLTIRDSDLARLEISEALAKIGDQKFRQDAR